MSAHLDDAPLARRRALAAELLSNGEGISEVSRKAGLSLPTVSKYKQLIERGGPEALAKLRFNGNVPRLDDASESWLVSAIKHSPGLHGYPGPCWTIGQLRELIFKRLGVQFSASHVGHLVRGYGLAYRLTYSTQEKASPPQMASRPLASVCMYVLSRSDFAVQHLARTGRALPLRAPDHVPGVIAVLVRQRNRAHVKHGAAAVCYANRSPGHGRLFQPFFPDIQWPTHRFPYDLQRAANGGSGREGPERLLSMGWRACCLSRIIARTAHTRLPCERHDR